MVEDPAGELGKLLAQPDDPHCLARFEALAAEESRHFGRTITEKAGPFEERFGFRPGGALLKIAVERMIDRGVDEKDVLLYLTGLLEGVGRFRASFREKHGMDLWFNAEAYDRLGAMAAAEGDGEALCWRLFANYPLGLQLLHEKTGHESFEIGLEAVEAPDVYLDRMIKEDYKG